MLREGIIILEAMAIIDEYLTEASGKVDYAVQKANKLPDEFLKVDASGSNSKFGQAVRKVDLLNNKLRRGEITKDQFETKYNRLREQVGDALNKKGSGNVFSGSRPDKNKPTMKPEDFKKRPDIPYRRESNLDENTYKKLKRHFDICNSTDDYNEYQNHRRTICNMLGLPKDATLSDIHLNSKSLFLHGYSKKDDKRRDDIVDGKAYHASNVSGLKSLNPTYRSSDGVLYGDKRVYFWKNKDNSLAGNGSHNKNSNTYTYSGKKINNMKVDPEMPGGAGYISTNDKLKVDSEKKNKVKTRNKS